MNISRYVCKREKLERVRLVGPSAKLKDVIEALGSRGYSLIQSGSYTNRAMFPKCDDSRFLITAERVVGTGTRKEQAGR